MEGWTGRFYEDFEPGDIYQHALGRTITEADNIWFTLLTQNTNQMHFNNHYSEKSQFGKALVNSGFTIALVLGQSVSDVSQNAIANLEMNDLRLAHPVFVGDTVYSESRVLSKRESKSRPYAGIIEVRTRGLNQDGDVFLTYRRAVMVYKRNHAEAVDTFPQSPDPIEGEDE
jgi:itaconyl-CoA hydratase